GRALGQRQVDAAWTHRRSRRADVGHDRRGRHGGDAARRGRTGALPPGDARLRVPVLSPDSDADRGRERRGALRPRGRRRRHRPRPVSAASRLAWRQARGAWRHFVLLGACVALGVAALVAVGSFAATLDHTLAREAKALTGGDLEIRAARPLDGDVAAALADLEARGATVVRVRELAAMARGADGRALLVELKAPGAGYPLYGRFEAAPPEPLAALLAEGGAVVQREALERLGVRVGDRLILGAATFTVRGTVEREPDRSASLVTLGPRVFVAADAIARTGLVQPGSRVRYRALVRLP